jgi:hypothetical protein
MDRAGAITFRIKVCKFLNALLFLLTVMTLIPSVSLAEETEISAEEVLLDVFINQIRKDHCPVAAQRR